MNPNQEFNQALTTLAQAMEKSFAIHQTSIEHLTNIATKKSSDDKSKQLRPLPAHYLFANKTGESFLDHAEKLAALKCLQNLSENEYIRTIKCSLTGHALRVSSTVDETKYLDKANGSREYIEDLERLLSQAKTPGVLV